MSAALRAVTRRVDAPSPIDVVAEAGADGYVWRGDGRGFAGRGDALVLELGAGLDDRAAVARVGEALAAVEVDDEVRRPGTGPVAIGALAYDRSAPGRLVVPSLVVGYDREGAWVTTVAAAGDPAPQRHPETGPRPAPPDEFRLTPSMPHDEWKALVADAVARIGAGDLAKVVLTRRVDVGANRPFVTSDILERLIALYPTCMVFRVGTFLGASPELLVGRSGDEVRCHPLAGTVARSGDALADRTLAEGLMRSDKNRSEHAFVIDDIRSVLAPLCGELTVPDVPSILELRNVSHLATEIHGRLAGAAPSALELVADLHPTPAVGGVPTDKAIAYQAGGEGFDRGRYTGPVGWVDGRGDGEWAIGLRSAEVSGDRASIFAGNGIVAGSEPQSELEETQLKLQALLAALVRP